MTTSHRDFMCYFWELSMELVKNAWYVAAWPREIIEGQMLARKICGESLILFRDAHGDVSALEDRCCHRELPLSKGWIEEGTVRCGYHGLRFDGAGKCVECPMQEKIPALAAVRKYPTELRHGWVWVWTGDAALCDADNIPPMFERNDHPEWTSCGGTTFVKGNYQLISDNLLDLTHETYIHRTSLGSQHVVQHPIEVVHDDETVTVKRLMPDHEPAPFWKAMLFEKLGRHVNADRWQVVNFAPPANIVLDVGVAPAGSGAMSGDRAAGVEGCNLNAITPCDEHSTWYFWAFSRKFNQSDSALTEKIFKSVAAIFEEDRDAIEAIEQRRQGQPQRDTISLSTDRGQLIARRLVKKQVEKERAPQSVAL
jgi:phenylpropionate dioxygenase-like ring-hydroxylating dioxygenase large terminal subunit